jgi:hypothetical protein
LRWGEGWWVERGGGVSSSSVVVGSSPGGKQQQPKSINKQKTSGVSSSCGSGSREGEKVDPMNKDTKQSRQHVDWSKKVVVAL